MSYRHIPAMLNEVVNYLNCRPGKVYVDGTLGGCGHARAICEKIIPGGTFIGIDQDIDAISNAETVLKDYSSIIHLFHGNFISLPEFLTRLQIKSIDGILLDLGMSQHHIENSGRGFSFSKDEPLDMRMDARTDVSAQDLINEMSEDELIDIFRRYGEERWSKKIAKAIDKVCDCKRVGIAVLGLEVPHAHIHLIPINGLHDIEFSKPKLKLQPEEFETIAAKIKKALQ